jgi:hypothetical protein
MTHLGLLMSCRPNTKLDLYISLHARVHEVMLRLLYSTIIIIIIIIIVYKQYQMTFNPSLRSFVSVLFTNFLFV